MSTLAKLSSSQIVDVFGAPVRVDFVKESRSQPAFGNLYTWDPETHSVVIAQFEAAKECCEPTELLLIPGGSIQNVQILAPPLNAERTGENVAVEKEREEQSTSGDGQFGGGGMWENVAEVREKFDQMFLPIEQQMAMVKMEEQAEAREETEARVAVPAEDTRKRSIFETIKVMDDFVQAKRCRVIDALNKHGMKYREAPFMLKKEGKFAKLLPAIVPTGKEVKREEVGVEKKEAKKEGKFGKFVLQEEEEGETAAIGEHPDGNQEQQQQAMDTVDDQVEMKGKQTMIIVGGGVRIMPPYGKDYIMGNSKLVKRITAILQTEGLFDDPKAKLHFSGCA